MLVKYLAHKTAKGTVPANGVKTHVSAKPQAPKAESQCSGMNKASWNMWYNQKGYSEVFVQHCLPSLKYALVCRTDTPRWRSGHRPGTCHLHSQPHIYP